MKQLELNFNPTAKGDPAEPLPDHDIYTDDEQAAFLAFCKLPTDEANPKYKLQPERESPQTAIEKPATDHDIQKAYLELMTAKREGRIRKR